MVEDLPKEYDLIIIGTGMTESILAAAASRIGKRVLHLDSNEYYGGLWASFNLEGIQQWIQESKKCAEEKVEEDAATNPEQQEGESVIPMNSKNPPSVSNVEEEWYISESVVGEAAAEEKQDLGEEEGEKKLKQWDQTELNKNYRKFNIDLAPKLLFARGALVELLISSNIARYTEFRNVSRVVTWHNDQLASVPCSRADVFSTQNISVVEKRMLMSLLTECTEYERNPEKLEEHKDQTFLDFLKSKKLTDNLLHYVLNAIAMATENTSCLEGMARTQKFLQSLGRYGNTPFLWPMYGSGEIPQAFCRLCAVFGGLYHLKRGAEALGLGGPEKDLQFIVSNEEKLKTNFLVMGVDYAPASLLPTEAKAGLSRAIFIVDGSILPEEKEHLTLLEFPPPAGSADPVVVIEVGSLTHACPPGLYVLHFTTRQKDSAKVDLRSTVEQLLRFGEDPDGTKPRALWSMYFNSLDTSACDMSASTPGNVFLTSGPDLDLDFDFAINQAKEIFTKMYSDCEFLPRAPDPEEIILEDDDQADKQPIESGDQSPGETAIGEETSDAQSPSEAP